MTLDFHGIWKYSPRIFAILPRRYSPHLTEVDVLYAAI